VKEAASSCIGKSGRIPRLAALTGASKKAGGRRGRKSHREAESRGEKKKANSLEQVRQRHAFDTFYSVGSPAEPFTGGAQRRALEGRGGSPDERKKKMVALGPSRDFPLLGCVILSVRLVFRLVLWRKRRRRIFRDPHLRAWISWRWRRMEKAFLRYPSWGGFEHSCPPTTKAHPGARGLPTAGKVLSGAGPSKR